MGLKFIKSDTDNKYIEFNSKKYVLNLDKIKEICFSSSVHGGSNEVEISQIYDTQDSENGELSLSQKIEHETKVIGNQQNDMIMHDTLKLLLVALLENDQQEKGFQYTFSNVIAINTLLRWGVLEEIE